MKIRPVGAEFFQAEGEVTTWTEGISQTRGS